GATHLANEQVVSLVQLHDIGSWSGTHRLGESLRDVLPPKLPAIVLLQGGYRPDHLNNKIIGDLRATGINVMIWPRVELENYLLDLETVARLSGAASETVALQIREACDRARDETRADFTSTWVGAAREGETKDFLRQAETYFDVAWSTITRRLE